MNAHADLDDDAALAAMIRNELTEIKPGKLPGEWSDDAAFTDELGLDSLDLVELVARLEQATGVYVPDEDLPRLTSVSATIAHVRTLQARDA